MARRSAGSWRSATSPTCSATSPRCPRSWPRPGSTTPWCGGECPRPSTGPRSGWQAPDGSAVRAEYLVAGYGNGAALPDDAKALVRRLRSMTEEFGEFLHPDDAVLLMNGTDHQRPQPWLGRVVAEANQIQGEFELAVTSLPDYLAGASVRGPARVARRAAVRGPLQPADGGGLQPGRREAGGGPGRALPRAAGRTALGPVPAPRSMAGALPRPGLDADAPQRRPRLDLRLLGRRGGRRRAPPLRRGPPDRRRPGRAGPRRRGRVDGRRRARWWSTRRPPTAAALVEVVVPADRASPAPTSRCCPSGPGIPGIDDPRRRDRPQHAGPPSGGAHRRRQLRDRRLAGRGRHRARHHHRDRHRGPRRRRRWRRSSGSCTPGSPPGPRPRSA